MTRDLSTGGVFLYTDRRITAGSKLEIVLILPSELGLGEKQWACSTLHINSCASRKTSRANREYVSTARNATEKAQRRFVIA